MMKRTASSPANGLRGSGSFGSNKSKSNGSIAPKTPLSEDEYTRRFELFKKQFHLSLADNPISLPPDHEGDDPELGEANPEELLTNREKKYFDDAQLLCHLRARNWNIVKSLEMIRETLRWRREIKPWTITTDEVEVHFKSGKNYHNGWDVHNRPVVVMRVRYDEPGDNPGKIKTILFQMERSLRLIEKMKKESGEELQSTISLATTPPNEQVAWIFDMKKFAKKDVDIPLSKELAFVLDHYPEKLGACYIVDPPVLFRAFWKMVRGFVDEKTRRKVNFVTAEDIKKKKFPATISEDMLEVEYSGNNDYQYHHSTYMKMLHEEEESSDVNLHTIAYGRE